MVLCTIGNCGPRLVGRVPEQPQSHSANAVAVPKEGLYRGRQTAHCFLPQTIRWLSSPLQRNFSTLILCKYPSTSRHSTNVPPHDQNDESDLDGQYQRRWQFFIFDPRRLPEGGCTRLVATTRIRAKKLGERQRESANSIPVPVGKKEARCGWTDGLGCHIRSDGAIWRRASGTISLSLSERRPGKEKEEEEDDDVDAMKVMNRCRGTAGRQPILFWDWMKFYPQ